MKGQNPMGKTIDFKPKVPRTDLAAEVAPKLEAARSRLAELEGHVSTAALAAALNEVGAANRLAQLNSEVDIARRDVAQLEGAHRLAVQRDAQAQAAIEAKARQAELGAFQRHADARFEAMVEVCAASEVLAKAYTKFLSATADMARAMPTGMIPHAVMWNMLDIMIDGGVFPAAIDVVVGAEMYRHGDLSRPERYGMLPGARPPTEAMRLRPHVIEPATEAVKRSNEYLIGMIREKFKSIEQAATARLSA